MNSIKAILIALFIWVLGVSIFSLSYYIPILEDLELQANLSLSIAMIPIVCLGMYLYYLWQGQLHGLKLGVIVLLTLILLDALITVPYLIIPTGGSYQDFFGSASFWLIALECLLIISIYTRVKFKAI